MPDKEVVIVNEGPNCHRALKTMLNTTPPPTISSSFRYKNGPFWSIDRTVHVFKSVFAFAQV